MTKFTEYLREDAAQSLAFAPSLIPKHACSIAADQIDDLLAALHQIDANAAESVEWIRRVARAAIAKAEGM